MGDHTSLEAWKESRFVARHGFLIARDYWQPWASALFSQLQRAALSVQLNIAEGWTFSSSSTCTRHLTIAYGSAVETGELLSHLMELKLVPPEKIRRLISHNLRSRRLLVGLLKSRRPLG